MKNSTKTYIAYGSNLNLIQMRMRCPTARKLGTTKLKGYQLLFRGGAGYAVATIEKKEGSEVPVLAWELMQEDEEELDRYEGYPHLYRKEYVEIELDGKKVRAMVYIMNDGRPLDIPSKQYLTTIASGYMSAGFDPRVLEKAVKDSTGR